VRLFAAEDAPDLSGTAHQDLLQAKQTKFMHTTVPISSSDLPPGFGLTIPISIKPAVADVIPEVPWHAPALFNLHPSWRVIAGGESKEVAVQRQRELRVLEAVYPRASSIPESPAEPQEPQLPYDDERTLVIPVVPVEDDVTPDPDNGLKLAVDKLHFPQESAMTEEVLSPPPGFGNLTKKPVDANWLARAPQDNGQTKGSTICRPPLGIIVPAVSTMLAPEISGLNPDQIGSNPHNGTSVAPVPPFYLTKTEPDVIAAATAACNALSQCNDNNIIDHELLMKFLRNPSMLKGLAGQLSSNNSAENRVDEISNLLTEGTRRGNGDKWAPKAPSLEAPLVEQELLRSGGDISVKERKMPVVAGAAPPSNVVFERPPGFSPALATTGPGSFQKTFNARMSNGPMQACLPHPAQNGQLYIPATRPPSAQLQAPLSVPLPSASQTVTSISGRPLSHHDEQYFKDLISQHGRNSTNEVPGGTATSSTGRSMESAPRWPGNEDIDVAGLSTRLADEPRNGETTRSGMTQPREKSRKACIYFNTPKGCRNGASCVFLHESSNKERAKRQKGEGGKAEGFHK